MRLTLMVVVGIVVGLAGGLGAQEKPARHVEKAAGFSFVPPKGWTLTDAAALAKADAAAKELSKAVQDNHAAVTEKIRQGILAQLKRAQPGSVQAKLLKQQLDQLEKQFKEQKDFDDASKKFENRSVLLCSSPAEENPAPSISLSVLTPLKDAKGKVGKMTVADVVAQYKYVAKNTNKFTSLVSEKKWKTDTGVESVVLVTDFFPATYLGDVDDRVRLRITQYIVELAPGRVLVATCSAAWDSKVDPGFKASLKTLRLEKP